MYVLIITYVYIYIYIYTHTYLSLSIYIYIHVFVDHYINRHCGVLPGGSKAGLLARSLRIESELIDF